RLRTDPAVEYRAGNYGSARRHSCMGRPLHHTNSCACPSGCGSGTMNHVYYCSIGKQYLDMARISAASVRRHNPAVVITVLTDQAVESGPFDHVIAASGDAKDIVAIKLARISFLE